jgi:hypothetical protein
MLTKLQLKVTQCCGVLTGPPADPVHGQAAVGHDEGEREISGRSGR